MDDWKLAPNTEPPWSHQLCAPLFPNFKAYAHGVCVDTCGLDYTMSSLLKDLIKLLMIIVHLSARANHHAALYARLDHRLVQKFYLCEPSTPRCVTLYHHLVKNSTHASSYTV